MVKARIPASVLVNHLFWIRDGENARNWNVTFQRNTNLQIRSHASNQAAEPFQRLRRNALASPRHDQQFVELIQQQLRTSFLVTQRLTLGATNCPLHAVFMKTTKEYLFRVIQIEPMQKIATADCKRFG